jgi:hypothetical protein
MANLGMYLNISKKKSQDRKTLEFLQLSGIFLKNIHHTLTLVS